MPELIAPTVRLHSAWLEAHEDWGPGLHEDGFGLLPSDEVGSPDGFAAWVARLVAASEPAERAEQTEPAKPTDPTADGRVTCTPRWIVEGDRVLGGIALRHGLGESVLRFGHIGYGIRPSARRRGLATWALGRMLDEARALRMERVLITCEAGNSASASTIARHGGVIEEIRATGFGALRRYWIEL